MIFFPCLKYLSVTTALHHTTPGDIYLFRIPDPRYDTQSKQQRKAESAPFRKTGFAEKLPGVPRPQRRVS